MESNLQWLPEFNEVENIQDCLFRAVDFCETFLPDHDHPHKRIKFTQPQKDAIDSIQFGFPLSQYDFSEVDLSPRGAVMVWPRQTGKTTACAYAAIAFLFIIPNCSIGIISASEKAAKKMFKIIKKILEHSILWNYVVQKTIRVDYIELTNGNFIEVWPCTENIRGSTYTYLFCDEAGKMEEDILFGAALPTTTHGKRWIMLSTPYGPKGKFIEYYFRGLESRPIICKACGEKFPQRIFNVEHFPNGRMPLDEMFPCPLCGAHDYKYGVGIFSVPWVDPWNDGIRSKELVKQLLDENDWTPLARQEYLAEIITDASMVFLAAWIKSCTNPNLKNILRYRRDRDYVAGVDYGRKHDASCFYITHRDERTGKIVLDFGTSVAGEFDEQRTYRYIRKKLGNVLRVFDPYWVVADATGLGDPLVEELEEDLKIWRKNGIPLKAQLFNNRNNNKGFIISRTSKPELIGNLIKMFAKGMIEIPPSSEPEIDKLREELLRFECEIIPGSDYIKYGTQAFHDDRVIALALSVWGHREKPSYLDKIKPRGFKYEVFEDEREGLYFD